MALARTVALAIVKPRVALFVVAAVEHFAKIVVAVEQIAAPAVDVAVASKALASGDVGADARARGFELGDDLGGCGGCHCVSPC